MKIYTKPILKCTECPNCFYQAWKFTCLATKLNLGDLILYPNSPIPDWCPLKNKDGK
jgi:hypothetical protein